MTYKTSRNFNHLTTTPTSEYRMQQRQKAEEFFSSFKQKRENREDYLSDPKILREALDEYEKIQSGIRGNVSGSDAVGTESFYYRLKTSLNSEDQDAIAKGKQADDFAIHLRNELLFFELSLAKISEENQKNFLLDPLLQPYYHFLEKQFTSSKYLLSPEGEKIMNLFSKTSYENRQTMTEKFLSKSQKEIELSSGKKQATLEELFTYTCDKDEDVRKQAIHLVNEIHLEAREMAENEINSILEYKKISDELRGFISAEEFLEIRDDISVKTINTMIDSVKDAYDFSRNFYKFKADLFGVKSFSYSEKSLHYGSLEKEYSFDEAINLVQQTLGRCDSELLNIFNKTLEDGMIDVFPKKGKRGGGFCTDNGKGLPTYILMNYMNKIGDVSTLIHESGHNACMQLQKNNLNALQYGSPISVAETPSTFYELLLEDFLQSSLTDEELLVYRMTTLDNIVATVPRQVAEYRFEQDLHKLFREKGYLSADEIGELFIYHMKDYTGDGIHYDKYDANRRISRRHTRLFFYVYSYASGFLISQSLLKRLKNGEITIKQVKSFFAAGGSKSTEQIFMDIGVDITKKEFRDEGLNSLNDYLNETKHLAKKLGKI